jgi:hypothetical protein
MNATRATVTELMKKNLLREAENLFSRDDSNFSHSQYAAAFPMLARLLPCTTRRDTASANGPVRNTFDARKVQNDLAVQQGVGQLGMQVMGRWQQRIACCTAYRLPCPATGAHSHHRNHQNNHL